MPFPFIGDNMAHTVTIRTLLDGERNTIIKANILGNGSTATELVNYVLYDASAYYNDTIEQKIKWVEYEFDDFSANLDFDAGTNELAMTLDSTEHRQISEDHVGGLANAHLAARTGDVLLSTTGLASSAKKGYIILHMQHRARKDGTR